MNGKVFEKIDDKLEEIIPENGKYTFLVGAGVSKEFPTNLPSAREIGQVLLDTFAPHEEVESLISLNNLFYEMIVEYVQKSFDKDLEFTEYFSLNFPPNILHYFLAHCILKQNYVLTTNFDYQIERALLNIIKEENKSKIYPIITKHDFMRYSNPADLFSKNFYPIYKIHGSKKNIITNEDTNESLITTLSALGKNKDAGKSFSVEHFKKSALENLMNNRTLIVIGYSGNDKFDIGPTLRRFPNLEKLIWIEHTAGKQMEINIVKKDIGVMDLESLSFFERLMYDIQAAGGYEVYRINTNTTNFIEDSLQNLITPGIGLNQLDIDIGEDEIENFRQYISQKFTDVPQEKKYEMVGNLYFNLGQYLAASNCMRRGLMISKKRNNKDLMAEFLDSLGVIYTSWGEYDKALDHHNRSLKINKELGDKKSISSCLNNIAAINMIKGNFDEALSLYEESLTITEELGDLSLKAARLNNIGGVFLKQGKNRDALKKFIEALQIDEELGDFDGKAIRLNNIGGIMMERKDYDEALKYYLEALEIDEKIGDLEGKATRLNNIGRIYVEKNLLDKSIESFIKALEYNKYLGNLFAQFDVINNLGAVYSKQNQYQNALNIFQEGLNVTRKLKDKYLEAILFNNIATVHVNLEEKELAIDSFENALKLFKELKKDKEIEMTQKNIDMLK